MYKSRIKNINYNTTRFKPFFDFFSTKSAEYKKKLYPFLIGLLILACITISSIWGIKNLWYSLTNLNIFKLSPSTFSFNTPTWVTDRFSNDIKYVSSLNQCYSMYEYNLKNNEYDPHCIQSNKLTRPPLLGNTWNDNGIKAGVELLKFLRANNVHNIFKILAIDVSNVCKKI